MNLIKTIINYFLPYKSVPTYTHYSFWKGVYTAKLDCFCYPVTIENGKVYIACYEFSNQDILNMTPEKFARYIPEGERHWKKWGMVIKELVKATNENL